MSPLTHRAVLSCALASVVLVSCSAGEDADSAAAPSALAREFSQQDKQAARALSLADNVALESASSPYEQALLCRSAIGDIAAQLRESRSLNEEQVRAIELATEAFDGRVRALASAQGKTAADIRGDMRQLTPQNASGNSRGRVAMACLQRLQAG